MCKSFRKSLMGVLILAIIVLPFRMAFSMPVDGSGDDSGDVSGQHCKDMTMASMSQNALTQLPDALLADAVVNSASQGDCCSMGDSDCTGCVHIIAVYFDFLQFSDPSDNKMFSETLLSFITRVISPPSRPPLILHI